MLNLRLFLVQRLTAMVMAPFVLIHLGLMTYAIQGGLSAGEILGRTQGSVFWFLFYGGFVLAAGIHGAIGCRVIAHEWLGLRGNALSALTWGLALFLIVFGMRAVFAVTWGAP